MVISPNSGLDFNKTQPILLIGGAPTSAKTVTKAFAYAESSFALDGGWVNAHNAKVDVDAIIGDLDSVPSEAAGTKHVQIDDPNTTDFEKALSIVRAPLLIAVGVLGGRQDHHLATYKAILSDPRPIILVGDQDLSFIAPPSLTLDVVPGGVCGFWPLVNVAAKVDGVKWPFDRTMGIDGFVSSSNKLTTDRLSVTTQGRGLLITLPVENLPTVVRQLPGSFSARSTERRYRP